MPWKARAWRSTTRSRTFTKKWGYSHGISNQTVVPIQKRLPTLHQARAQHETHHRCDGLAWSKRFAAAKVSSAQTFRQYAWDMGMPHPARLADDLAAGQSATHAPVPADWHSFRHFLIDTTCCLTIKRSCVWKIRYSSPHGEGAVRAIYFIYCCNADYKSSPFAWLYPLS